MRRRRGCVRRRSAPSRIFPLRCAGWVVVGASGGSIGDAMVYSVPSLCANDHRPVWLRPQKDASCLEDEVTGARSCAGEVTAARLKRECDSVDPLELAESGQHLGFVVGINFEFQGHGVGHISFASSNERFRVAHCLREVLRD